MKVWPFYNLEEQQTIDKTTSTPSFLKPMENIETHLKTEGDWDFLDKWVIQGQGGWFLNGD